jgi:hypothetical protein
MKIQYTKFMNVPTMTKKNKPNPRYKKIMSLAEKCMTEGGWVELFQNGPYREVYPPVVSITLHWDKQ